MKFATKPIAVQQLLREYRADKNVQSPQKIVFSYPEPVDVYNISAEFEHGGRRLIAGRVERRDSEISSVAFFGREPDGSYRYCNDLPTLANMQDPCVCFIDGDIVIGGTQIDPSPLDSQHIIGWRTLFFKGTDLNSLSVFAAAPHKMKDVRLLDVGDSILVLTRPQGYEFGAGKIGRYVVKKGAHISDRDIQAAPVFGTNFVDSEWGGANEMHLLSNGRVGVLGHIARFDEQGNRHYYAMAFGYDIAADRCTDIKIIAERADFLAGAAKRSDLEDVLFAGGLKRLSGGKAILYTGTSDAEAQSIIIPDPFTEYER